MVDLGVPPSMWGKKPVRFGRLPQKARHLDMAETISLGSIGVASVADANRWANKNVKYRREVIDFWSSAQETLRRGFGDCEDIAILKRAMLRQLGIQSWVLLVFDKIKRRHHAVLLLAGGFLDLHISRVLPLSAPMDYRPILAFGDGDCTWLYANEVGA